MKNIQKLPLKLLCGALLFITTLNAAATPNSTAWPAYKQQVIDTLPRFEGWCTKEKANRMMELIIKNSPDTYVEIGVFGGSSFYPAVAALDYQKKGMGFAIDPWTVAPCLEGYDGANYEWWSKVNYEAIMSGFISRMKEVNLSTRYRLMRMTSAQALTYFQDGSIKFLHIDGQHSEKSSYFDVVNWLPKVAQGGIIIFDDANWAMTKKAVDYLLANCALDPSSNLSDPYLVFQKR